MKNSIGKNLIITLFGESHGKTLGIILDGLSPGMNIDEDFIKHQLDLRRPWGKLSTQRVEPDNFQIVSGLFNQKATGTPLCILIPNVQQHSSDYSLFAEIARPGHADYTANCKYHGFQDYRGGGHSSGRLTAALVAAGGIVIPALEKKGIAIGSHLLSCGGIKDTSFLTAPFLQDSDKLRQHIIKLNQCLFATIDENIGQQMQQKIQAVAKEGDSVGGVIESVILGLPTGLGEPWFDSFESMLSHALFSIPAVKGVQFGAGFTMADALGSEFNDAFRIKNNAVVTDTNNNGGINGGITNGMPVIFSCAIKPTPSIYKTQNTVNFKQKTNYKLSIVGRHDPAIIHRARVVIDSVTALFIYDLLLDKFGPDYFI